MPHRGTESPLPPPGSPERLWYALYVRSQQERTVEHWLERSGVEHFTPFISRVIKDRTSNLERTEIPLLPGYVFCRHLISEPVEFAGQKTPLVGLPGVVLIVGRGSTPEAIPETEIESLRILCSARVSMCSIPLVTSGDYVRVTRGPLAGAEGYVSWIKSATTGHQVPRITVSVTMLGRSVSAELDGDWLEKAKALPDGRPGQTRDARTTAAIRPAGR